MTFGVKQLLMTNPHTLGAELALGKWQKGLSFFGSCPWTAGTLLQLPMHTLVRLSPCVGEGSWALPLQLGVAWKEADGKFLL